MLNHSGLPRTSLLLITARKGKSITTTMHFNLEDARPNLQVSQHQLGQHGPSWAVCLLTVVKVDRFFDLLSHEITPKS